MLYDFLPSSKLDGVIVSARWGECSCQTNEHHSAVPKKMFQRYMLLVQL